MDRVIVGPELLKDMEDQMVNIKKNLKVAQDRKKSHADKNRTPSQFQVGIMCFSKLDQRRVP